MEELLKEIQNNPKGKAILFFIFYAFFFLIIVCVLLFGKRDYTRASDYERGNATIYSSKTLLENNYSFTYSITLDDKVYYYEGMKRDNYESFQYLGKNYYRDGNDFYVEDGTWFKCENPYLYSEFLDTKNIDKLINLASYLSKTSYESGKMTYNYLLSTNTINKEFYNMVSDFLEEPNQIVVSTDEEKHINQVLFLLDSYCSLNKTCIKNLKIDIQFDQIGKIEKIDKPIIYNSDD